MRRRVAITGTGVICSLGNSGEELHTALCEQRDGVGRIEDYLAEGFAPRPGGKLPSFESYLQGKPFRPLDRTGRLVAAAATLALRSSGWEMEALQAHEAGLVLGTMFSSMHTIGQFDRHAMTEGPSCASPLDFANTVINSAAGQTAIWHKLRGINSTVSTGATSGLMALGYATDLIAYGSHTVILAGGADEFCFEAFCGLERAGLLRQCSTHEECSVPFDVRRNGLALTEACALLMLEEWNSASERGACILGEIKGHGNAYNPLYHQACHGADGMVRAMRAALNDAQLHTAELDCISACANGSHLADAHEGLAIGAVFNGFSGSIPVTAIKSMLGESLGSSGILQAIDLIQTIKSGRLPGILGLRTADPQLPALDFCRETQTLRVRSGLINSLGFDGHACSLVIGAPPGDNGADAISARRDSVHHT